MHPGILDLEARAIFFPVRHHSPSCAQAVRQLIERLRPSRVLIEGPSDFNARIEELHLAHALPIAIYSWFRRQDGEADVRRGAFYPFCVYSPEWQALQAAREVGAKAEFIDVPWAEMSSLEAQTNAHRYAEPELRQSSYVEALCRKLDVPDLDALWDRLFEVEPPDDAALFVRCHRFCYGVRASDAATPAHDLQREAFMAARIRQALSETDGRVFVVTGGFHSYALFARLNDLPFDHGDDEPLPQAESERGIALTPYSYERLDALTGYEAGMPSPGFYDRVWHGRDSDDHRDVAREMLAEAVKSLRKRKQIASSADLIATMTTAQTLANLRGHARVWRRDLIDGIVGALVKDELQAGGSHPFLDAVHDALRGQARGKLAPDAPVPPLVLDLRATLHRLDLETRNERTVELDLSGTDDLERSRTLHRLRVLRIAGFEKTGGSDLVIRDDLARVVETWRLKWSPEFEASTVEASIYGPNLPEAATARLLEAAIPERDFEAVALLLLDAALMGLGAIATQGFARLQELTRQESDFFRLARGLNHLLYLFHFDEVLGTTGLPDVGALLREGWERGLWLLETLGNPQGVDKELLQSVATLLNVFERCRASLDLDRSALADVLRRAGENTSGAPLLRGAATGALWTLGEARAEDALSAMRLFSDPKHLGDFLTGLFSLAREAAQRHPELVAGIDALLVGYDDTSFLEALPSLRLAFSFFTPREKHHMARTLMQGRDADDAPLPDLEVDAETAARVLAFEVRLFETLRRYGLRGAA